MWRLQTLGALALLGDSASGGARVVQRRQLALLALLDAGGPAGVARERILALLWPEATADIARHSLAQLVYRLRGQVGEQAIISDGDALRLDPGLIASDRAGFEALLEQGDLEGAVAGYGGPYLDGFGLSGTPELEYWIERERARLAARCSVALEALGEEAERRGDPVLAAEFWRQRLAAEPLNSRVVLRLMHALAASGDAAGALQRALQHGVLRREELELGPDAGVAAFACELRGRVGPPAPSAGPSAAAPGVRAARPAPQSVPRRWRTAAMVVGATALLLVLLPFRPWRDRSPRQDHLIVLGAFETPDSTLGLAVREAVRAELENTPGVRVLEGGRLAAALHQMELPPDVPLPESAAAELAQRQGAALAVVGSVTPVGDGALIVVRLIDGASGTTVATLSARPSSATSVLADLARLSRDVSERARGAGVPQEAQSLPAVTTGSLDALRDYAVARRALGRFDRTAALQAVNAALEEDSLFALARYLKADLLWFSDHEHAAEQELSAALALSARLPLRERLVVRARYQQLVADRTDSALAYWSILRDHDPDQALAYEGMAWSYRAQGRWQEAAAVADSAMALDSSTVTPSATNRVFALLSDGDTTAALATATAVRARCPWLPEQTRFTTALLRGDWYSALASAERGGREGDYVDAPYRQVALLGLGREVQAREELRRVETLLPGTQYVPRARLVQAWVARMNGGSRQAASVAARRVLDWIEAADLSAPAVARLAERVAELAARAQDTTVIDAARQLLLRDDAGRNLPSYVLALRTVEAARLYVRGEMRASADLMDETRRQMFFGRALAPLVLLEADARTAAGEPGFAHELYRLVLDVRASAGDDVETWALVRQVAVRRLEEEGRKD